MKIVGRGYGARVYAALEGRVIVGIEATDSLHLAGFSRRTEVVIKIESVTEEMHSVELSF